MKQLLRVIIVILLLVTIAALVFNQSQFALLPHSATGQKAPAAAAQVAAIADAKPSAAEDAAGKQAQPVVMKLLPSPEEAAEREKDREIQRGIEHNTARIAEATIAEDCLLLFQAIIYFLTLLVLYMLMENVKKFATAANVSAQAAKQSALTAEFAATRQTEKRFGFHKFPPHFYRKR